MSAANLVDAIAVTAELTATSLSPAAQAVMAKRLLVYPRDKVFAALERCQSELRNGAFTLGAVVERINQMDGRPSSDEAWALSLDARDEIKTVVWCEEMQQAFAVARPLLAAGDEIGARMAFKGAYDRLVAEARQASRPARWSASLGWDKDLQRQALTRAAEQGRLPAPTVEALLPPPADTGPVMAALRSNDRPLLGSDRPAPSRDEIRRRVEELRAAAPRVGHG